MNRVLEVDVEARVAWVEPGVLNLDLSRAVAHLGLHYAPDPSSQQACTIGGNVGDERRRPALPRRRRDLVARARARRRPRRRLGRPARRARARRRPASTCAAASSAARGRWASRPGSRCGCSRTRRACAPCSLDFTSIDAAAATVSAIIAAGHRPVGARDDGRADHAGGRGLRRRRLPARRGRGAARRARRAPGRRRGRGRGRRPRRLGSTARARCGSRPTRPSGRCSGRDASRRSARSPRIKPDYYLHDAVVPRTRLLEVLRQVYAIAEPSRTSSS